MPYGKKSPAKMGHSPAEMESAKQERKNLLDINPIAKHASGVSWMSKHSKSAMHMGHSPAEMGHSPAEMGHSPLEIEDDGGRGEARKEYDIRKGILDPKTGKRTFKESKRKQEVFVTKMGKVLPVGSKDK